MNIENRTVHRATGGYLFITIGGKTRYLHIDVAEASLGKKLPDGAEVHHVNGNPADNRPENLVICPNHEYHSLLHQREAALAVAGNPNLRACRICGIYDKTERMNPYRKQFYHAKCLAFQSKQRRKRIKALREAENGN